MFLQFMLFACFIILNTLFLNVSIKNMGLERKKLLHALVSLLIIEAAFIISLIILSKSAINETKITFTLKNMSELKYFLYIWFGVATFEEIAFRGILFNSLVDKFGDRGWIKAAVISSIIFGLLHLISGKPVVNAFFFGILFCIIYRITCNLYFVIILHALSHGVIGFQLIPKPIVNIAIQYASTFCIMLLLTCITYYLKRIRDKSQSSNMGEFNANIN